MLKHMRNTVTPTVVEQRTAFLAGKHITYTLKRTNRRRSIGLRIDDRGLCVSVPMRASEKWLNGVLQDKAYWVVEKLEGWHAREQQEIRWADGETIPYLGELLTLCVVQSLFATPVYRCGHKLWVFLTGEIEATGIEHAVSLWYQFEAEQIFCVRVAHYASMLGAIPRDIKLSVAKTQWGSCTTKGTVRLNVQLIKLPLRLIDYVVVHELAHLREMNHSSEFWKVVESACPDYVKLRKELKGVDIR